MARPNLLVAEPEPLQAISVRKLVLETAKFNVITAHSSGEALELVERFPAVDAAILVIAREIDCDRITEALKSSAGRTKKSIPVIALTSTSGQRCNGASHHVSAHEPQALLDLMRSLLGDPRDIDQPPDQRARRTGYTE